MKAATLLLIAGDVVALLKTKGFITAADDFDETKFNDIGADAALASGIEAILKAHGVAVPGRVDALIQILPLLAGLLR